MLVELFRKSLFALPCVWTEVPLQTGEQLALQCANSLKSILLRVNVFVDDTANEREHAEQVSVATFDENQEFMLDAAFALDAHSLAAQFVRDLMEEKFVVVVYERNGTWSGSSTVRPKELKEKLRAGVRYVRAWLGTYDWSPPKQS